MQFAFGSVPALMIDAAIHYDVFDNLEIFAVNMLVFTTDGDTFSFNEIAGWLEDAGFEAIRLLEVPAPSPLILATKPAN